MKEAFLKIAKGGIKTAYLPFSLKRQKRKVVLLSRQQNKPSYDFLAIERELKNRGVDTVVLCKKMEETPGGYVRFLPHMLKQMHHIAEAKLILLDGYSPVVSVLPKNPRKKIIQLWHSLGAIKQFGYQSMGKPGGRDGNTAKIMNLHGNYDIVLAPGKTMGKFYSEAFGIDEDKVEIYGLPRVEYLAKNEGELNWDELYQAYPEIKGKTICLYAPTFRRNRNLDIGDLIESFEAENMVLVIKGHPMDKGNWEANKPNIIVDKKFSSTTWLKACQKLITDYSAIALEGALLNKELYIYQPDIEDYSKDVGINIDYRKEALGKYFFTEGKDLWNSASKEYDREPVKEYLGKYIEVNPNNCMEPLIDHLMALLDE